MKAKINFNFLLHLIRIVCLRTTFFFNSKSPTNKMENKNHEAHCEIYFEAFTRGNHSTWLCVYKRVLSIFIYIFQQKALEKIYQTTKHWNLCNAIILIILFHFFFLLSFLPFFLLIAGRPRLGICSNGVGSFIFMALHHSITIWHIFNFVRGTSTVSINNSNWFYFLSASSMPMTISSFIFNPSTFLFSFSLTKITATTTPVQSTLSIQLSHKSYST